MSAPPKPWEGVGINARSASLSFDSPSRLPIGAGGPKANALRSGMDASDNSGSKPPPLPPRPQAQRSTGGYMYGGPGYGNLDLFPSFSFTKKLSFMSSL